MTEGDYAEMSEAMNATVGEFPAETEGIGNQVLEPRSWPTAPRCSS